MAEVIWPQRLVDRVLELPDREHDLIFQKVAHLESFPEMYPVRASGPFRGLRFFVAASWLIYYRAVDDKVYLRALYPARLP